MSGQISGQVPNQVGMPQGQNGMVLQPAQMQNLVGGVATGAGPEVLRMRQCMLNKIFSMLQQRQPQADDVSKSHFMDVARRLEERLARTATSKEHYLDLQTLEARIMNIIKSGQRHANSSSSVGTMTPTPGISCGGNPNLMATSSGHASGIVSIGMRGVSFSNGYQQSTSGFSTGCSANDASMGAQRMTSQMIPTPGLNNNGFRAGLQQKSYRLTNGSLNGGLGINGNNVQLANGSRTSEGFPSAAYFGNSVKPLQRPFDQLQRPVMQGEGYAMGNSHSSGSGNFYGAIRPTVSMENTRNMNSMSLNPISRANPPSVCSQSNLHGMQKVQQTVPESINHLENMSFQSSLPATENLINQQQPYQFQYQPQVAHQQYQQNLSQEQQHLLNENRCGPSELASDALTQVKCEPGFEHYHEVRQQASKQIQPIELQNQFPNTAENRNGISQVVTGPNGQQNVSLSLSPRSQQKQKMMQQHHLHLNPHDDSSSFSFGPPLNGQWPSQSQDWIQESGNSTGQENFYQRMPGQPGSQCIGLSTGGPAIGETIAPRSTAEASNPSNPSAPLDPSNTRGASSKGRNENDNRNYENQRKWLVYLFCVRKCSATEGKCQLPNFIKAKDLLRHMNDCNAEKCIYPRCHQTTGLVNHYRRCKDLGCPVCVDVKNYLQKLVKQDSRMSISTSGSSETYASGNACARTISEAPDVDVSKLQPSLKRLKVEHSSQSFATGTEGSAISVSATIEADLFQDVQQKDNQQGDACTKNSTDVMETSVEVSDASGRPNPRESEVKKNFAEDKSRQSSDNEPIMSGETICSPKQKNIKQEKDINPPEEEDAAQATETSAGSKSGKSKIKGVSLIELFTTEQVREHIRGLRKWVGQSKAKVEKNQAMERSMNENSCQLCAVEKLTFEPPPMYCTPCGARIKRNAMYYTVGAGDGRHFFCIPCYNESRGDTIIVEGTTLPKARFEKKKNDEEIQEWWVQCDKCEAWQHQICALFNGRMNDGQAEYTCPNCYIEEVERGERKPLPPSAVLGAKDLPSTILSDYIEHRLFERLRLERQDRARLQGKSYDEVPGAEALVVRVISSVDKKLEVKPRFLELFREEKYPTEFPYKSKVILLFQKIEGVELCLFGMYVQEFGSECASPNQRRVYLSYLDSVKYFRPEVKTVSGEALRTFVYHEILIGYLEYCKKRGFTSCYIWACPPLKGEDYILYCHPEIQKTPKSDKLREWYLSMLRKAAKEKVVVEWVNLYDHFFRQTGESKAKVTAARLPYFDGDYWPGTAEDLIYQMNQDDDCKKLNKKGSIKKAISKRALKATGHSDLSANVSKDLLLMHKLGESICPMKEDFIMVHLQHCCTHCCILMVSGTRWVCNQCKNFQICDQCYEAEQSREDREKHPVNQKEIHTLYPMAITDVPDDTKDRDDILESEFFDTRQAFLSLCQGNHYQYDTLRRAKHSSMMVLYHLHNPTAPAFVITCHVCHLDIETGQGWHCEVCPEYEVCSACYSRGISHPHKLTNHPSAVDGQNQDARQRSVQQVKAMLKLLAHASSCRSMQCQYPNCRKVKTLFRHGLLCKVRASGGCALCKKMWCLLQIHARACKESICNIPRCRDLKDHWRRIQQQSDSRRRAAVMEMMRQRAAEVASTSA